MSNMAKEDGVDYQVNISITPWTGQCREYGNTFTLEQAEIIAEILARKRAKLSLVFISIPNENLKP